MRVSTVPAGAEVTRVRIDGVPMASGTAPFLDTVWVEYDVTVETPTTFFAWIGAGLSFVVAVAGVALAPRECGSNGVSCPVIPLVMAFGGGVGAIVDVMAAVLYGGFGGAEPEVVAQRPVAATPVRYRAEKTGYERASEEVDLTAVDDVVLRLEPILEAPELTLVDAEKDAMIVTVPPLTSSDKTLPWLDAVKHRLHLDVTAAGVRTVETGALDRMLREVQCTDERCDVEIGRALAASHVLRARVTKLGDRCVLAAELIDLQREVSVAAASARGTCDDARIVDQLTTNVSRDLFTGTRPGTSAP